MSYLTAISVYHYIMVTIQLVERAFASWIWYNIIYDEMEVKRMEKNLTFIHAADLHLDSPFKGLANIPEHIFSDVLKSTFTALDRLIEVAIERKVDFIILAGDLFDNERKSLKVQIHLRNAFEKLNHYDIYVYLSYGNHDYINGNIHQIEYPENVYCFPDEKVRYVTYERNGKSMAAIYGFSFENQAVKINKSLEYEIVDDTIPFHIAMLHGSLSSNAEHNRYAPFQLGDLIKKRFDYWALGHIHRRDILSTNPPVVYPGNTQGRHRKETGEKGCYHVTLTETDSELSFIPLQSILFNTFTVDVSHCSNITQLEMTLKTHMDKQLTNFPQLVHLTLLNEREEDFQGENKFVFEEMIDIINDTYVNQKNWLYIYRHTVMNKERKIEQSLIEGDHFIGELTTQLTRSPIESYLNHLYQHRQARKYLEPLSTEDIEKIREEAYDLLVNKLLN